VRLIQKTYFSLHATQRSNTLAVPCYIMYKLLLSYTTPPYPTLGECVLVTLEAVVTIELSLFSLVMTGAPSRGSIGKECYSDTQQTGQHAAYGTAYGTAGLTLR
jgi:hypothetical protein